MIIKVIAGITVPAMTFSMELTLDALRKRGYNKEERRGASRASRRRGGRRRRAGGGRKAGGKEANAGKRAEA